jgi:hypothetical protein
MPQSAPHGWTVLRAPTHGRPHALGCSSPASPVSVAFRGPQPPVTSSGTASRPSLLAFPALHAKRRKIGQKGRARRRTVVFVALRWCAGRVLSRGQTHTPTCTGHSTPGKTPHHTQSHNLVQHHSQTAPTAFVLPSRTSSEYRGESFPGRGKLSGSCQPCVSHDTIRLGAGRPRPPPGCRLFPVNEQWLGTVPRNCCTFRPSGQTTAAGCDGIVALWETTAGLNHAASISPQFCRHCRAAVAGFASI